MGQQLDRREAALKQIAYLKKEQVFVYPDHYVDNKELHPISLFNDFIKPHHKLGIELDSVYSKATYYIEFQKLLKAVRKRNDYN